MKWNGIVSLPGTANIRTAFTVAKITQPGKSQRLTGDKGVSDIAHRLNSFQFKLRAQSADAHVHDVASRIEGVAPHICKQLITGAHLARTTHEMPHQDELAMRQRDLPVFHMEHPALQVEPHPTRLEPSRRRRYGPILDPSPDARDQLGDRERLRQVVDRPHLQAADLGLDVADRGQDEDTLPRICPEDTTEHLVAVQPRQQEIQHDDRVVLALHEAQRLVAVRCHLELKTVRLQGTGNETADALFVVDDEDPAHRNPPLLLTLQVTPQIIGDRYMCTPTAAHRAILCSQCSAQIQKWPASDMSAA